MENEDEVELSETGKDYEVIPVTPIRRLEKKIAQIEQAGSIPQLQNLINQIIELIRSNQKIVNEVVRANSELRNEISKLPPKMDELTNEMRKFLSLVEAAGREEITAPSPEIMKDSMKPLAEQLQKLVEQNERMVENNQSILEQLDTLSKKIARPVGGTPVSRVLSSYPTLKFRREEKKT